MSGTAQQVATTLGIGIPQLGIVSPATGAATALAANTTPTTMQPDLWQQTLAQQTDAIRKMQQYLGIAGGPN